MPPLGIGTYELRGDDCVQAVRSALQMGYRLIDTAAAYRNEDLVGEGIATSGVPRHDIYVVVKIAMKSMGTDAEVRRGILDSIQKLRIHYADCVLMHWPGCGGLKPEDAAGHHAARARCWRVMKALQLEGIVRHLGVSNFLPRHFPQLGCFVDHCNDHRSNERTPPTMDASHDHVAPQCSASTLYELPAVNQIELHPLCVQREVDEYCRGRHGMVLQQYSPLGKGDARLLRHPRLLDLHARFFAASATDGDETGKKRRTEEDGKDEVRTSPMYSVPDMLLMWGLAQGYCTLVRSHNVAHLRSNLAAAEDYFASLHATPTENGAERTRPVLTAAQLDALHNLRRHMGVENTEDLHLCWYSAAIA
ncbi:putative Aldo/keto reductase [Leptomonas pyrrhocoris]|uniref:Putative Aldo/keto reductase n=1 Tax=Leptomonas pyrrhocoris TaxID=157538 RepID=A0A0N0E0V1_LEPPY|nr:putative Aldo/keto reductase [Leptomonas pyrrhocoris]KPA86871.1 putative Aldo/keto reductase [Leptomonas pyrrhocoris]|eukprot:XP_015665310.1 putative Aldo/keto reductase [Leptomonas pyrrhocoris]